MTTDNWLRSATNTLTQAGIETARLDSLVLLENILSRDRSWILAHAEDDISEADSEALNKFIVQRSSHYPLAYITHKAYFYNAQFFVNDHVLIPRPESEAIIEVLQTLPKIALHTIIDVGTGSGALAITAKCIFPKSNVIALDIDPKCLKVAMYNAKSLKTDIVFVQSDLLTSLPATQTGNSILLANLPYVPDNYSINDSAKSEPELAIFGGNTGLEIYARLFRQIGDSTSKVEYIITESLPIQHLGLISIAEQAGYDCTATNDFVQLFSRRR
jgi:release factor glutamine methyltransferase